MFTKGPKIYSLRKCKKILYNVYRRYRKKQKKLSGDTQQMFERDLKALQQAIWDKNQEQASNLAQSLEKEAKIHASKNLFDHIIELIGALVFALVVALFVRQMWFEFYVIPSGSMRPTLKEEDMLVVSKTDYGINTPMRTSHFYFDPSLVKRGDIVVFSAANMDITNSDETYFYVIPGKKQLVKRMIGKPGDTLYFYGGQIYGIDVNGNPIQEFQTAPWFTDIEHIPFLYFHGKEDFPRAPQNGIYFPVIIYQMNEAVAKLSMGSDGKPIGEMLPQSNKRNAPLFGDFGDLWGFKNYAMVRMLSANQLQVLTKGVIKPTEGAVMYLEFLHNPSVLSPKMMFDGFNRMKPSLRYEKSYMPIDKKHLESILDNMVTCRFVVKKGVAHRLEANESYAQFFPRMPHIPDGTYEFDRGTAYKVRFGGILEKLPKDHPLYSTDPEHIQLLYNIGMDFDTHYSPSHQLESDYPTRYAYFRDQHLYIMGAPIFHNKDPNLQQMIDAEKDKQSLFAKYPPFVDLGPPVLTDGTLDKEMILKYGIRVPPKGYLVLGDNHAMSGDSRVFGFVPQDNIRGAAELIFWPPGPRFGKLFQPYFSVFIFSRIVIWIAALICICIGVYFAHRRSKKPLQFK